MTGTVPVKFILKQFLQWLEVANGNGGDGATSEFALEAPREALALAETALVASKESGRPVLLASSWPVKSIISTILLNRAGIEQQDVFDGLSDRQLAALADVLRDVKSFSLLVEMEDGQVGYET